MVEILGFDQRDTELSDAVTGFAAKLCIARGMSPSDAYGPGERAAAYSSELLFTALREMGIIPDEEIDVARFNTAAEAILQRSNVV